MLRILFGDKCGSMTTNDLLHDYDLLGRKLIN